MYYLELLQRFWDFNQKNQIGAVGISMYLFLLKTGYDNDRYDFRISDVMVSKVLGLTRKTVKSTKEKLKKFGLIEFQIQNGLPCYYRLLIHYPLQISEDKRIGEITIEENFDYQQSDDVEIQSQSVLETKNASKSINPEFEIKQSKKNDLSPSQLTTTPTTEIPTQKNIPSFEEFIEYAQTLEIYDVELDFDIKEKYESWVSNGWQNNSDRPITNWKSTLKSILPYMKNSDEDHQLSLPTIPIIKRPKNFDKK
jgi:hypothetical protein